MAVWDFVKDAGKSLFGSRAEASEAQPQPQAAPEKTAEQAETDRKVAALNAEVKALGLTGKDVHLRLRGDTVIVESKGADRETMEKLILAVGNIQGIAKVEADLPDAPDASGKEPVFHTVQAGETLSAIAKKHLGNANKYNDIFEANRPMLSHPDKIYPGQKLRIPGA
ncbi:MAG: peptidoglycan-binding protein LysM [Paracoccus sp. (in: a-proteobacteria)]|uniref:peptidoglycan-binding protein LysM n=1 Tax=Paracoccus sp. TaxID=267 RepID=UPI0026E03FD0|nr:peptidoglycan-binding protein LysM [Paracoccus sp. (in: a-proteobacteria)]MDO5613662.1 peptidoglycan-binding protein LysM [Paracoccus sp. (in: a-proteobacteria)]